MNDEATQILQSLLASLKALKFSLESQIALAETQLSALEGKVIMPAGSVITQEQADDPDVLGIDTIGRIIKKRKLSPELVEKKRQLMASIRERRLRDIEELKRLRAEKEKAQKGAPVVAGAKRK